LTRFGYFLPFRTIVYFGQFFEKYSSSSNFGQIFFNSRGYVLISTKMGWATFWSIFSQTQLVTLNPKTVSQKEAA
jgi:hypothetical protein